MKLSQDDIKKIKELRESGSSLGQIALKYGVTRGCISQRLKNGTKPRKHISYKTEYLRLQSELEIKNKIIAEIGRLINE